MQFVLEHAETRLRSWKTERWTSLRAVQERCPQLETIIYTYPRGLRHYSSP